MADRRQVLSAGLAGALLPVGALASAARAGQPPAIHRAVYDRRFAAGRAFAAQARARGWATSAIEGDVTALWYDDLALRWRQGPATIAGVTAANSLFVLERLAWDAGMRVVSRSELEREPVLAWLIAPAARGVRA